MDLDVGVVGNGENPVNLKEEIRVFRLRRNFHAPAVLEDEQQGRLLRLLKLQAGLDADLMEDIGLRHPLVGNLDAHALSVLHVLDAQQVEGLLGVRHIGGRLQRLLLQRPGAAHRALDGQRMAGQGFVQQAHAGVGNDRCIPAHMDTSLVIL